MGLFNRMENKQILLDNINNVHTTKMGIERIKKNIKLENIDIVEYCKNKILDKNCNIFFIGIAKKVILL